MERYSSVANTVLTKSGIGEERGLARIAQRMAAWTEKWFPDAYVFALAGVVLIIAWPPWSTAPAPVDVADTFGDGFWDLTAFTLQMAMVVLTGYVVATSPPVARLIERIALVPVHRARRGRASSRSCPAWSRCSTGASAWSSAGCWPAPSPAAATCASTTARSAPRRTWASAPCGRSGLSSSAAQLQATPASLPPELLKITGVLDFGNTIFTWQSLLTLAAILIALTVVIAWFVRAPGRGDPHGRGPGRRPRRRTVRAAAARTRPGEWLEYSPVLPAPRRPDHARLAGLAARRPSRS